MPNISLKVLVPAVVQLVGAIVNLIASQGWTKVVQAQVMTLVITAVVGYLSPHTPAAAKKRARHPVPHVESSEK